MAAPSAPPSRALLRGARDRARSSPRRSRSFGGLEVERPDGDERPRAAAHRPARAHASRCARTSTRCRSSEESGVEFASERAGRDARLRARRAHRDAARRGARAGRAPASCPAASCGSSSSTREELAPGGARELVAAGVMEGVDFVYGCHLWTPLRVGKVAARAGAVHGRRGLLHARDHRRRRARRRSPTPRSTPSPSRRSSSATCSTSSRAGSTRSQPAVVTVGSFHAGDAPNVIPGEAVLDGHGALVRPRRARADARADRGDRARRRAAHGADVRARLPVRLQARRQRPSGAELVARALTRPTAARSSELDPIMGGDDFSAYLAEAPGCYAFVGAGGEEAGAIPAPPPALPHRRARAGDRHARARPTALAALGASYT